MPDGLGMQQYIKALHLWIHCTLLQCGKVFYESDTGEVCTECLLRRSKIHC